MLDLVQWFMLPNRDTHHLEGTTLDGSAAEKVFHVNTGYSMQFIKDQQGFPVEIKPYDSEYIYDRVTELNWTSPKDFKQFNPMLSMCPRFWDGLAIDPVRFTHPLSRFEVWQNCKMVSTATVGQVLYTMTGPADVDFGGDVGMTPSIVIRYYWNGIGAVTTYNDREELYLTQKAGWVKWTHAKWTNGVYQIDQATLHNQIILGGPPAVQLPCGKIA
jgi:hypothetical protein